MITEQHMAEDLSEAYVRAVAARARITLSAMRNHDYGVDGTFNRIQTINGRRAETGFKLDFQLKASKNWTEQDGKVIYDLPVKNYNDLVDRATKRNATPFILVLLCLPDAVENWIEITAEHLLLRKFCFWHRLSGPRTDNAVTKRIEIPSAQRLTAEAVSSLLEQVEKGELQ